MAKETEQEHRTPRKEGSCQLCQMLPRDQLMRVRSAIGSANMAPLVTSTSAVLRAGWGQKPSEGGGRVRSRLERRVRDYFKEYFQRGSREGLDCKAVPSNTIAITQKFKFK